jgi:hypothetical protein
MTGRLEWWKKARPPPSRESLGELMRPKEGGVMSARNEAVSSERSQVSFKAIMWTFRWRRKLVRDGDFDLKEAMFKWQKFNTLGLGGPGFTSTSPASNKRRRTMREKRPRLQGDFDGRAEKTVNHLSKMRGYTGTERVDPGIQ